ncbi:MAG TPA: hypothetical protein VH877_14435 [Polyangia bacterium]|jgi:hypothetical protein|nr:hypothetical protein [Polyangia bacterium]
MSKLESALTTAQSQIPECIASGYVDMTTGMLLAVRTVDSHPREVLELVAAATADLFQGQNVSAIEKLFRRARGVQEDNAHYFEEIIVLSSNLLHIFTRGKKYTEHAIVFVCRKTANIGMALAKSRLCISSIEASL